MRVGDKKRVKKSYSGVWFNVGDIVTIEQIEGDQVKASGSTYHHMDLWWIGNKYLEDIPSEIVHKVGDHVQILSVDSDDYSDLVGTTRVVTKIDKENVSVSEGGSLRYNKGKPEFSHLSPKFILAMADLMTKSAEKYSRQNWLMKQDIRTASDSLFRHFTSFMSGEDNDNDSGKSHLLHLAVNAMIMWENYEQFGEEVDNRFYKTLEEKLDE